MPRDFVVALMQQWELFSWNGPRKQGFLFAIKHSRREIGMLIFQRTTIIGRSQAMSRISFNKPAISRVVAEKREAKQWFGESQTAQASLNPPFRRKFYSMRQPEQAS